jgi:hypothetical protein
MKKIFQNKTSKTLVLFMSLVVLFTILYALFFIRDEFIKMHNFRQFEKAGNINNK